jgi:hypothetical protein
MYHNFNVPRRVAAPCFELFPLSNNDAKEIKRHDRHRERQTKIKGEKKGKKEKRKERDEGLTLK